MSPTLLFALVPALAIFIGGAAALYRPPDAAAKSFVQHFAAGVVFAALVGEVLPDLTAHHPSPLWVVLGFGLGVALMVLMRWVIETKVAPPGHAAAESSPLSLILVVGLDILIDGLLIGIGISLGQINGTLLTIALGIEILFLGLSTGGEMIEAHYSRRQMLGILAVLMLPPVVGVLAGSLLLAGIAEATMIVVLSFAAAALLYLVTEELLVKAHEVPETPFSTAAFFVGFLVFYILEMVV